MGKLFDRLTHKLEVRCRPYCAALVAAAGRAVRIRPERDGQRPNGYAVK